MDVDIIHKATTEANKVKYCTEGCCFNCDRQGHLSCFCLDKKPCITATTTDTNPFTPSTPIMAKAKTNPFKDNVDTHIRAMAEFSMTLDAKQQEKLAKELKKLGAHFQ